MATYVVVHGGAHGGGCYGPVARILRAAGHDVHAPTLTGVADRATDRIGHLVYLDVATPADGQPLAELAAPLMNAARARARVVDGVELVLYPGTESMPNYGVTDPDAIAWMSERLTPHPFRCFEQPLRLTNEAAVREIAETQIVCTSTLATRDPARMEPARAAGRLWDIDAGHDLTITEPEKVAELLLRLVDA